MATQTERERWTLDSIYQRRAVRSYAASPLDEAAIRKLLDAAVHAPTAMHEEPWAFLVVQDAAMLKRLSDRGKAMALADVSKHSDLPKTPGASSPRDLLALLANPGFNIFYNAGTLIVICGKAMGPFVTADCWLAAENLMLAASAMGLGTCCIGFSMPVLNAPDVKRELGIPADITAIAPIIVGVPSGPVPPVPRKPPEILRWVRSPE